MAVRLREELLAVELVADWYETLHEADTSGGSFSLVFPVADNANPCVNEEDAEDDEYPDELVDERRTDRDEQRPQRQGTEDAPEQDAVLVTEGDGERRENHGPHEDVVDAERFLDKISRDVLTEGFPAPHNGHAEAEEEAAQHPESRLEEGLAGSGLVGFSMAVQVGGEQCQDDHPEDDPGDHRYVDVDEVFPDGGGGNEHGGILGRRCR